MSKPCSVKCHKTKGSKVKSHKDDKKQKQKQKKEQCTTNCHESFNVDVRVLPEVTCKRIENNNRTTFEIELDIKSQPNCRVIKKEVYDPTSCKTIIKQILLLESDVKLECIPKIKQIGKPSAKYEMDIIVDTKRNLLRGTVGSP